MSKLSLAAIQPASHLNAVASSFFLSFCVFLLVRATVCLGASNRTFTVECLQKRMTALCSTSVILGECFLRMLLPYPLGNAFLQQLPPPSPYDRGRGLEPADSATFAWSGTRARKVCLWLTFELKQVR
jgi:hypothetical protein